MNLSAPQKNALYGLDMLLRLGEVRVTRATLRAKLWQHPDFPSMSSLSDTLDELKVDNIAAHLSPEQLPEIPLPALAYLHSEGGIFAPVRMTDAKAVEWFHTKRGWQKDSLAEFSQKWNGVTLLIEPTERSGEVDYAKSRKKQLVESLRLPFVVLSLVACLGVWAGGHPHETLYYALLLLKMLGFLVSGLLVWYSLDANNPFLRSICQFNARTNCSTVLNTAAAKLFGWLSWAEVGLFYFGGGLLALLFFQKQAALLYSLLLWMTIATLPYTFWSIYYQWRRARQWCVLCLTVQGLLWLEFGLIFSFQRHLSWPTAFGSAEIGLTVTAFLLLPALWALWKPVGTNALRVDDLQRNLQRVKFDIGYIDSLARQARILPPIFEGMQVPTLGNAKSVDTLIVVTNPTCSVCAKTHVEIEALIATLEDVKCQIIHAVSGNPNDIGAYVAHLILSQPNEEKPVALHRWYTMLRPETWFEMLTVKKATDEGSKNLALHSRWCELAGVKTVPAIFFNNVLIPRYYTISEIGKLIRILKIGINS